MFDQTIVMYLSRSGRACSCAMPSKGERGHDKRCCEEGCSTIIGCAVLSPSRVCTQCWLCWLGVPQSLRDTLTRAIWESSRLQHDWSCRIALWSESMRLAINHMKNHKKALPVLCLMLRGFCKTQLPNSNVWLCLVGACWNNKPRLQRDKPIFHYLPLTGLKLQSGKSPKLIP